MNKRQHPSQWETAKVTEKWQSLKSSVHHNMPRKQPQDEEQQQRPKEWRPIIIRDWSIVLLLTVTFGLFAGVLTLVVLSKVRHGFTSVKNVSGDILGVDLGISLLWVVLPSAIFGIYGQVVAAAIDAFGFRQPFVELVEGAPASKTIALDYRSLMPGQREWTAFRNRHWHLAVPFVISLLLKTAIGPLAARVMVEQPYAGTEPVTLNQAYALTSTIDLEESPGWDLLPVLNIASATKVYSGSYSRWVDGHHTFLSFDFPPAREGNISQASVTATTSAYFARLECQVLDDLDGHLYLQPDPNNPSHSGRFYLNGTDNGCFWRTNFQVSQGFTTYLRTESNTTCGDYGGSSFSGRFIVAGGAIQSMTSYNLTVLSCVPTYWVVSGDLTMDLRAAARNPIMRWDEDTDNVVELRPQWWDSFEQQIQQVDSTDTTTNFNAVSATAIGRLILDYARRTSLDPFAPDTMIKSSQEVFASVYATLLDQYMVRRVSEPVQIPGKLTTTTDRLFVVYPIAGVILAFLVMVSAILALILWHTHAYSSVLFEEPVGLLGHAGLLVDSVVYRMAGGVRTLDNFCGQTSDDVTQKVNVFYGPTAKFRMEDRSDPAKARIVMDARGSTRRGTLGSQSED
ncbi:hypothetical protein PMZ80_011075 [Knufia obscura]|uniref:Uncharacterized protein n=1 Tax=Knufia obscura TaxID=1635080 RepID=A0ABR0R7V3_9EURO|nr:hypothetical protein PMZ80_011075 [Knufia obscura]